LRGAIIVLFYLLRKKEFFWTTKVITKMLSIEDKLR
jgi:hypothetical protein